jgi:hypothetical protein
MQAGDGNDKRTDSPRRPRFHNSPIALVPPLLGHVLRDAERFIDHARIYSGSDMRALVRDCPQFVERRDGCGRGVDLRVAAVLG